MAQATHASNPRRRGHQSLACEKSSAKAVTAPNGAIGSSGHGIAELAQELADLQALYIMLADAEGPAERARIAIAAGNLKGEEHTAACKAVNHIEDVGRRAHAMVGALEEVILGLEPRTPDEVLSLALILVGELDVFFCSHVKTTDVCVVAERRSLEDTLRAIIRGLVGAGATSPLTKAYAGRDDLVTWAEARSTATREAAVYVAREEEAQ